MAGIVVAAIEEHFAGLSDPRRREPTYPLLDMVVMTHCAVICGADDFVAIAKFARSKQEWFAKFLDLSQGIPSQGGPTAGWPDRSLRAVGSRSDRMSVHGRPIKSGRLHSS